MVLTLTVGSVCTGIGSAAHAWKDLDFEFKWFAENEEFQSSVLKHHYPDVQNFGDMLNIKKLLEDGEATDVDLLCGGDALSAVLSSWITKRLG